jgi:hypothetical protein
MALLGDPTDIDIDDGLIILRLDETTETFAVTWISEVKGKRSIRRAYTQSPEEIPLPPTARLAEFLNCMENPPEMSRPAKIAQCLPQLRE